MKTTFLSIKNVILVIGLVISMNSVAQTEVLLGQYSFDGGSKSATNVAPNVTFGDIDYFTGNQATFSITYETISNHTCLTLWNNSNTLNVKRGFLVPITPAAGKNIVITRMDIIHKAGNAGINNALSWIVDAFSSSDASTTSTSYFFGSDITVGYSLKALIDWTSESIPVVDAVNLKNSYTIAAKKYVIFNASCIGSVSLPPKGDGTGGKWNIDDIQFFGYALATAVPQVQKFDNSIKVVSNGIEITVDQAAKLNIHTLTGALVYSQEITGTKSINLTKGVYLARLSDDQSNIVKKVIIK